MINCLNPYHDSIKPGISVFTVSKAEPEKLLPALKSWLAIKEVDEIIIADFKPENNIYNAIKTINDPRIILISIINQPNILLTKAFNLSARFTSRSAILKIDDDIILGNNFFKNHTLTDGESYLNDRGVLYCHRKDFIKVNGYDETIKFCENNDIKIHSKLRKYGIKINPIKMTFDIKNKNVFNLLTCKIIKIFYVGNKKRADFILTEKQDNYFEAEELKRP